MDFTVFSADPGTKNFACSLLKCRFKNDKLQFKLLGTCMLPNTLTDVKDKAVDQLQAFAKDLRTISSPYKPNVVCIERFQSRGLGGTTIESINMMLGTTAHVFSKVPNVRYITAATWKNRVNKHADLKGAYTNYGLQLKETPKEAHELDASLIGIYMAYQHVGLPDFQCFEQKGKFNKYVRTFLQSPDLLKL